MNLCGGEENVGSSNLWRRKLSDNDGGVLFDDSNRGAWDIHRAVLRQSQFKEKRGNA